MGYRIPSSGGGGLKAFISTTLVVIAGLALGLSGAAVVGGLFIVLMLALNARATR